MAKKKKLQAVRIVPFNEVQKCGCLYCYDNECTIKFNPRKLMDEKELQKFNKKIGRGKHMRYFFCPHETCPYASEFEGYDTYLEWLKEKKINFSFESIFSGFPPNATFAYSNKD